jgi:hypothetical protein
MADRDANGGGGLWGFLSTHKRYWLAPMVTVLVLFGILLLMGQTSAGVFVYTLF